MVFSALDNLTKGSSGQAIQNANLMLVPWLYVVACLAVTPAAVAASGGLSGMFGPGPSARRRGASG